MVRSHEELLSKPYVELVYPSKDVYQTPSGKIEFYSETALRRGYPPPESPGRKPTRSTPAGC